MKHKILVSLLFVLLISYSARAQVIVEAQAGLSYLEHASLGIGCAFSARHTVSFLYGSNFGIHPKDFASYLLQYNWTLPRLTFSRVTPTLGVKGGTTIFSDDYYRWNLLAIVPQIGFQYAVNEKTNLVLQAGAVFSFEQSVKRISYNEIGQYKDLLPEIKIGVVYNLIRR
jgi:hypothetical protein